jgi:hypothetical protein
VKQISPEKKRGGKRGGGKRGLKGVNTQNGNFFNFKSDLYVVLPLISSE